MTEHRNYESEISDAELDLLLSEWAEAEVAVPEGFHETVMTRLRAEQSLQTEKQKKSKVVLLAEQFTQKKTWVSAAMAAALILCCLPVLQSHQMSVGGMEHSKSQVYDTNNPTEQHSAAAAPMLMTTMLADTQDTDESNINGAITKSTAPEQDGYYYATEESRTALTPEERLTQAQDELALLEAQLAALDDDAASDARRKEMMAQMEALKTEIELLQEELTAIEP